MIFNRPAIVASVLILLVGIVGYLAADNERAWEKCTETQSDETCNYTMR